MAWNDWEAAYTRQEATPLDRFKNKNRILKTHGPPGVRVYDEMDGVKSARQVQTELNVEPGLFARILEQLLNDGALSATNRVPVQMPNPKNTTRSAKIVYLGWTK